jgi:hypothetical protein
MLPRQVMAKKAKVVYVARNPRDVVVSFLNHWMVMAGYQGSMDSLLDAFLAGVAGYYSPFLEVRSLTHFTSRTPYMYTI